MIAEESGEFTFDDVAADIVAKLRRRNPHVFGTASASGPVAVNELWEQIKAAEKQRDSVTDGLPPGLPALLYADKVLARARAVRSPAAVGRRPGVRRRRRPAARPGRRGAGRRHRPRAGAARRRTPPARATAARATAADRLRAAAVVTEGGGQRARKRRQPALPVEGPPRDCCVDRRAARSRLTNAPPVHRPNFTSRSTPVASIAAVGAREILDSRGNPTVEVEVALDDGVVRARGGAERRVHRRLRGRRAARRRQALPRQGRRQGRRGRHRDDRPGDRGPRGRRPAARRPGDARPRRHAQQGQARRQRDPRRLAGGGPGRGRQRRPAALPLRRRPQRAPAAGADDEHPQRRLARRLQRRRPGVHDRADRRGHLRRGAAPGRRGLPRAQVGAEEEGPGHRARRRGRLRPRPRLQPGRPRPDRRGRQGGRPQARARTSRSRWTSRPRSSTTRRSTPSRARRRPPTR